MTKPLSSFPEPLRANIAKKRASSGTPGLGKLSAEAYLRIKAGKKSKGS